MRPVAQFVLYGGFDPLDVLGPFEVLVAGDEAMGGALDIELVAAAGAGPVTSGLKGITLTATATFDPSRPGHVFLPGVVGPVEGDPDDGVETIPVMLSRLADSLAAPLLKRALENPDVTVWPVCGGSLALAMAGLIEGRNAATHVLGLDVLDATGVNAVRARVVDDGDLVSSGGVTSGLDLGLYFLEREFGPAIARSVEDLFEHERRGTVWKPAAAPPARPDAPSSEG